MQQLTSVTAALHNTTVGKWCVWIKKIQQSANFCDVVDKGIMWQFDEHKIIEMINQPKKRYTRIDWSDIAATVKYCYPW